MAMGRNDCGEVRSGVANLYTVEGCGRMGAAAWVRHEYMRRRIACCQCSVFLLQDALRTDCALFDLHDKIWKATKLCSECKVHVSQESADALLAAVKEIHEIFWATKGRDVEWVQAS